MKRLFKTTGFLCLILIYACSTPTESPDPLEFRKMHIEYSKFGGWTNFYTIEVSDDRSATYIELSQNAGDTIANKIFGLNTVEKEKLSQWFASFNTFRREYQPSHWYTDGDYHTIVLNYDQQEDTVSVYEPENCNLPTDLSKIIDFFESRMATLRE